MGHVLLIVVGTIVVPSIDQKLRQLTDDAVLQELGQRLERLRLVHGLSQAELATNAGVSKRTVERIEHGFSTQLANLIRICRALDLLDNLDQFIPQSTLSPIEQLDFQQKQRRRAKRSAPSATEPKKSWSWAKR